MFSDQVCQKPGQEFALATLANSTGSSSVNRPQPRVRICAFRGFFPNTSSVRDDVKKAIQDEFKVPYPLKTPIFGGVDSDTISFTTDERMDKVEQLITSDGAVEAGFYLKDRSVQWRFKGTAYIVGGDIERGSGHGLFGEREARMELGKRLRKLDIKDEDGYLPFGWESAVTVYFANQSPVLRGKFPLSLFHMMRC